MEKEERILVPLDGSECAETILPRVEELVAGKKTGICLLRVVFAPIFPGVDPTEAQVKVVREAEEYLQGLKDRLRAEGLDVDIHVRYGDDVEEILDHAARREIDLVAMSTHGRSGVKLFSSEAWQKKSYAIHRSRSSWFDAMDRLKNLNDYLACLFP
jgi:nucleotide-binding universal stress UspA family protein